MRKRGNGNACCLNKYDKEFDMIANKQKSKVRALDFCLWMHLGPKRLL